MTIEASRESIKISGPELLDNIDLGLFDVDGILLNTHKSAVAKLKNILEVKFGRGINLDFNETQIAKYGQLTELACERGFDKEEAKAMDLEHLLWNSLDVLGNAELIPGASELITWLIKEKKKQVKAYTSRPPEAEDITRNLLKTIGDGMEPKRKISLSIRSSHDEDRHMFKAINAVGMTANYGRVLAFEDMPEHAANILAYDDRYRKGVWVILVPYGMTPVPSELLAHPRLICIERRADDQGIGRVQRYLKGEPI